MLLNLSTDNKMQMQIIQDDECILFHHPSLPLILFHYPLLPPPPTHTRTQTSTSSSPQPASEAHVLVLWMHFVNGFEMSNRLINYFGLNVVMKGKDTTSRFFIHFCEKHYNYCVKVKHPHHPQSVWIIKSLQILSNLNGRAWNIIFLLSIELFDVVKQQRPLQIASLTTRPSFLKHKRQISTVTNIFAW